MRLQDNLTNDHEKRYNSIHQQKNLLNVLRRSVEIAAYSVEKLRFEISGDFICDLSVILYSRYEGVVEVV